MRYLVQFIVPAIIVLITIALLSRNRRRGAESVDATDSNSDAVTFILILLIGSSVSAIAFIALGGILE